MAEVEIHMHVDEAKKAMADKVIQALNAVGLVAESDAKLELEHDPRRVDTGRLRNSITHTVVEDDGGHAAVIGTNVEYAIYVHEGTGKYAAEGGGRQTPWVYTGSDGKTHLTHGMKPNRFLRNAIEQNRDKYKQIIDDQMKNG